MTSRIRRWLARRPWTTVSRWSSTEGSTRRRRIYPDVADSLTRGGPPPGTVTSGSMDDPVLGYEAALAWAALALPPGASATEIKRATDRVHIDHRKGAVSWKRTSTGPVPTAWQRRR